MTLPATFAMTPAVPIATTQETQVACSARRDGLLLKEYASNAFKAVQAV